LAVSLAVIRVLEAEAGLDMSLQVAYVAGHSLGEYSALAAAQAFSVADAARLVKRRGQAMQKAVPVGEGAMAALLGIDVDVAREIAAEAAAFGSVPSPTTIARARSSSAARRRRRARGGDRRRPGGAPLDRAPGQRSVSLAADGVRRRDGQRGPRRDRGRGAGRAARRQRDRRGDDRPGEIKELLVEQATRMVRWRETVLLFAADEVEEIVEIGAGRVLAGLVKRIDRNLPAISIGTPAELEALVKRL